MSRHDPVTRRARPVRSDANYDPLSVSAYLTDNYRLRPDGVIEGTDFLGWTLNDYILPRLASGLYFYEETR